MDTGFLNNYFKIIYRKICRMFLKHNFIGNNCYYQSSAPKFKKCKKEIVYLSIYAFHFLYHFLNSFQLIKFLIFNLDIIFLRIREKPSRNLT